MLQGESKLIIKCPFCGTPLSVKNIPGIEKKNLTCPVCKCKAPFTSFKSAVKMIMRILRIRKRQKPIFLKAVLTKQNILYTDKTIRME